MQEHMEILKKALLILKDRQAIYGEVDEHFTRAAQIASLWQDKPVTPRDVAMIMASVKMARIATTPGHEDSFVDLCNYVAFAASFSGAAPADGKAPTMPPTATLSS
jgi:hypothetical protein